MGQPKVSHRALVLDASGGANDTIRCWAHPIDEATQSLSVHVTSRGAVVTSFPPTEYDLTWTVLYGGYWSDGRPYELGTTHNGGVVKDSNTITGGTAVQSILYTDAGPFLDNLIVPHPSGDHALDSGRNGFPIVCQIANGHTSPVTVYVSFFLETVADWR
jgi:hypothetical protein